MPDSSNKPSWMANAIPVESVPETPQATPSWRANAIPVESPGTSATSPSWMSRAISVSDAKPTSEEYRKLRKEMDVGIVESITESPLFLSKDITDKDLEIIGKEHGIPASELRKRAAFQGASLQDPTEQERSSRTEGLVSSAVAFGIPQKISRASSSPEMERALDDIKQLADARKSLALGAAELITPGGIVGAGAKGLGKKVLAGAATGALYGAGLSRQDEVTQTTAGGAVLGSFIPAAGIALGKTYSKLGNKAEGKIAEKGANDFEDDIIRTVENNKELDESIARAMLDPEMNISPKMADEIAALYNQRRVDNLLEHNPDMSAREANSIATEEFITRKARNVADDMRLETGDDVLKALRESGQGEKYTEERIVRHLQSDAISDLLESKAAYASERSDIVARTLDFLSDSQFVLRSMDEKMPGLGIEAAHKKVNKGVNQMSFPREEMRAAISGIYKANKDARVDKLALDAADIIHRVEKGNSLTAEQQVAWGGFRDFFSKSLDNLNSMADKYGVPPLNITKRENYVPAQLMDFDKLDTLMGKRVSAIVADASAIDGVKYKDLAEVPRKTYNTVLANKDHKETIRFLRVIDGIDSSEPAQLSLALKRSFLNPTNRTQLETVAKAALEREDVLPMWARETNLYKLADKWTTNTLRHMFLREGIEELNNAGYILSKRGMGREAEYIKTLVADLNGVRKGTAAAFTSSAQRKYYNLIDKKIEESRGATKEMWETVRTVPAILQGLSKNLHANLLGLNPRTHIMNLTQTFTKTLPEFGPAYGSSLFFRGAMSAVSGKGLKGFAESTQRLRDLGLMPAKYIGGSLDYLAEGVLRRSGPQALGGVIRKSADITMHLFERAELVNRVIALRSSETLVDDLIRGNKLALTAMSRLPTSISRGLERAVASGDRDAAVRIIAPHIINSTQYQYNRASLSEYGRTMGPIFSAFSKWPTATLGQAVEAYRTKGFTGGTKRVAEALVMPWMLLEAADMAYLAAQDKDELSDREEKLLSKQGLSQAAPIGNLKGIITGDFFTPPAVDLAMKTIVQPWVQGDIEGAPEKILRGIGEGIYTFAPGGAGAWVRFLTDDVLTMTSGERPEGTGFLERTQEGIERLGK